MAPRTADRRTDKRGSWLIWAWGGPLCQRRSLKPNSNCAIVCGRGTLESEPSAELLGAVQSLAALGDHGTHGQLCMLRGQALEDLLYEMENEQNLPLCMKYNGGARCRLRQQRIAVKATAKRTQAVMDHLEAPAPPLRGREISSVDSQTLRNCVR